MTTALADLRDRVADAITGTDLMPEDATVLPDVVDSLSPPAYLVVWGTPWLLPSTYCAHAVRLDVVCIAGRMDPAPGIETLETMVSVALNRLRAARLPEATVLPPGPFEIGGVRYLAARLSIETQIQIPEPVPPSRSSGAATLTATATLTVTGVTAAFATKSGAAVLVASATLTVTGSSSGTSSGAATLSAGGTLTATGQTIAVPKTGAAVLVSPAVLTATGSTSGAFSPTSIPGVVFWADADDASTLTVSGGRASEWRSKVGTVPMQQATFAAQPQTTLLSGRGAFYFDGAASMIAGTTFSTVVPQRFVAAVVYMPTLGEAPLVSATTTGTEWRLWTSGLTGGDLLQAGVAHHVPPGQTSGPPPRPRTRRPTKWSTGRRCSSSTTGSPTGPQPPASPTPARRVCGSGPVAALFTGVVGEIVMVDGTVSSGDRASLQAYFHAKWGV